MRPLLIATLITLPCTAQPALELTRNEASVYRDAPGPTKYMDQSVTFPHSDWALEGMPIGNGRLRAMVFGGPLKERIQFNDITLWTGGANESGKYDIDDPGGFASYQNFGDLFITTMGMDKYDNHSRSLDLAIGIHTTRWTSGGITYTREVFASHPDDCIVIRIASDKATTIQAAVEIKGAHGEKSTYSSTSHNLNSTGFHGSLNNGLRYAAELIGRGDKGNPAKSNDGRLEISGSTLTLILLAGTDYQMDPARGFRSGQDPAKKLLLQKVGLGWTDIRPNPH